MLTKGRLIHQEINLKNLADLSRQFGELRVEVDAPSGNGEDKTFFLRTRTLKEIVQDFFGLKSRERKQASEAVLKALEPLLKELQGSEQLLENIRLQIEKGKGVDGRVLADGIENLRQNRQVAPVDGAVVAATPPSRHVGLAVYSPFRVRGDYLLVRSSTLEGQGTQGGPLARSAAALRVSQAGRSDEKHFTVDGGPLHPKGMICMEEPVLGKEKVPYTLSKDQMRDRYASALLGLDGHIVIEPLPDIVERAESDRLQHQYSDEGIDALLLAIAERSEIAKAFGRSFSVTISTPDQSLVARIRRRLESLVPKMS